MFPELSEAPPKASLPIEAQAPEKPCHSEEGYARRGNPFSKCFEYMGIYHKTEVFKDADCHVAPLLAMTLRI